MKVKELKESIFGTGYGSGLAFAESILYCKGCRLTIVQVRKLLSNNNELLELKDGGYVIVTSKTKVIRIEK